MLYYVLTYDSSLIQRMYALQVAEFVQNHLWDESTQRLRRSFCRNPSAVQGFADDYAFLISKHILDPDPHAFMTVKALLMLLFA